MQANAEDVEESPGAPDETPTEPVPIEEKAPETSEKVREGRRFAAVPLVNFNSDDGFGYGAKAAFYNYGNNEKPYRSQYAIQLFFTEKHVQYHSFEVDFPRVHGGPWRFQLEAKYDVVLFSNYFGSGNTVFDSSVFGDVGDPASFSESDLETIANYYHSYERTEPKLTVNLRRRLGDGPWQLFLGFQGKRVTVDPHSSGTIDEFEEILVPTTWQSFLEQTKPYGFGGGDVGTVQLGIVYDSRDQEASPQHGSFFELSGRGMYFDAKDPLEAEGNSPTYGGANVTVRKYISLGEPLVLAMRFVADFLYGDVPFFELDTFGGLNDYRGLGGEASMRGVRSSTFQGKIKALVTPELRWTPFAFGNDYRLGFVAFADVGRVWDDYTSEGDGLDLHEGYGAGVRFIWSENFIVRLDAAKTSSDDVRVYLDFDQVF